MADWALVSGQVERKPDLDAPVVLKEDVDADLEGFLSALLRFALKESPSKSKSKSKTHAFTAAELKMRLVPTLREPFAKALERGIEWEALPSGVAWVLIKG